MLIKKINVTLISGLLTPLQSDTLYGHFCWRLLELKGESVLDRFIDLYAKGNPVFTLSDGLYEVDGEVLFPKPIMSKDENSTDKPIKPLAKEEKIKKLLNKKKDRENRYIAPKSLQAFLDGDLAKYEGLLKTDPASSPKIIKDLRIHVGIDRNTLTHGDGLLFEQNPEYLGEKTSYAILVKILDESAYEDFEVESIFKDLFMTGFGKKKSSGYGAIEWHGMDDYPDLTEPVDDCNGFYTLGNYLPSIEDEIKDGYYRFFVKYGKLGETGASGPNPFKRPMIMMKPGSCFEVKKARDFYGRLTIPGEISTTNSVVQFGMPFTLNYKKFPKSDSSGETDGTIPEGGSE
jgi:CRISPR-associated protein Csm4